MTFEHIGEDQSRLTEDITLAKQIAKRDEEGSPGSMSVLLKQTAPEPRPGPWHVAMYPTKSLAWSLA